MNPTLVAQYLNSNFNHTVKGTLSTGMLPIWHGPGRLQNVMSDFKGSLFYTKSRCY